MCRVVHHLHNKNLNSFILHQHHHHHRGIIIHQFRSLRKMLLNNGESKRMQGMFIAAAAEWWMLCACVRGWTWTYASDKERKNQNQNLRTGDGCWWCDTQCVRMLIWYEKCMACASKRSIEWRAPNTRIERFSKPFDVKCPSVKFQPLHKTSRLATDTEQSRIRLAAANVFTISAVCRKNSAKTHQTQPNTTHNHIFFCSVHLSVFPQACTQIFAV